MNILQAGCERFELRKRSAWKKPGKILDNDRHRPDMADV